MKDTIAGQTWGSARTLAVTALALAVTFTMAACGSESSPVQSDPSTAKPDPLSAACEQLVGHDGLVARALAFTGPIITTDPGASYGDGAYVNPETGTPLDRERYEVQEALFAIVVERDARLVGPVGQLVDLLDDPAGYASDKDLTAKVQRAASEIRRACARQRRA